MEDRVSLNGKWKFSYAEDYREAVTGFEQPGYDVSDWDEIPVPSHIQLSGGFWPLVWACGGSHPQRKRQMENSFGSI